MNAERPNPETLAGAGCANRIAVAVIGVLLLAGAAWLWFRTTPAPRKSSSSAPPGSLAEQEVDPSLPAINPGYVGIETCAECHASRAAEFKTTRHYLACTLATGGKIPGFDPGRGRYDTNVHGLRYEMTRSGDDFLAAAVRDTPQGDQRTSYK